ncbi:MAG: diguanylate cyclase [Gammaproteobacteria bacterium]|nr:diguanylate cyclase [Gammaproteobacteria bacterium]
MISNSDFDIKTRLYEGNKNIVFRAIRKSDSKAVIVKTPRDDNPSVAVLSRYYSEYDILKSLQDLDSVINVYTLTNLNNTIFLVEEDTGDETLSQFLKKETIGIEQAIDIAIQLADVIANLHQRGIVHKDINPGNILWSEKDKKITLIDFGIASLLSQEHHDFQNANQLEGSMAYLSPEQTGRINRLLDYRSDLYSLGITLYQLFTGVLPFSANHSIEMVHAHIARLAVAPHLKNKKIPEAISQIIMKLMNKMADDRYQTATGLKTDLQFCLQKIQNSEPIENFIPGNKDLSPVLQVSQKIYGREQEINILLEAFERISEGEQELCMLSGFSGTGKTALVNELHQRITEKRGNYISAKFDQYQRDVPYYAWRYILDAFVQLLLKEDRSIIEQWQVHLLDALGNIGQVIIDLVPDIELIIGPQEAVPSLSGEQALNRFQYAFGELIHAISTAEQPLVIFIDDWQWADAASINLLKYLVNGRETKHLLMIVAWRDNELKNTHLYSLALDDINQSSAKVNQIHINNLELSDVSQLINDTLHYPPNSDQLIQLIYEKTLGNAFFLRQFLKKLFQQSLLYLNKEKLCWDWDIDKILESHITDNVVELMSDAIQLFSEATQDSLRLAACIGNTFDVTTLSIISQQAYSDLILALEPALKEGIIKPLSKYHHHINEHDNKHGNDHGKNHEILYQFIHDRVQQAAYGLIDREKRAQTHYQIAVILLDKFNDDEKNKHIFAIINHINQAEDVLVENQQQDLLVKYNTLAAKKAKAGSAYLPAFNYFTKAIRHLSKNAWTVQTEASSELFLLACETAFLVKQYEAMETWLECYLENNSSILAHADGLEIRLQAYISQNRLNDAVATALNTLKLLGIKIPQKPSTLQVIFNLLKTKYVLSGKTFDDLLALPEMRDPVRLKIMRLLGLTIPPAYWTSQELVALIVFQMVRESIRDGYSPNTGYAFSWWGITLGAILGDIDRGYKFGAFGETIARKFNLNMQQPVFFKGWITQQFKQPIQDSIEILSRAYNLSMEKGDHEYASYALNNSIQAKFHSSMELSELLQQMQSAHQDLESFKVGSSLYWHDICWQMALNFKLEGDTPAYELNGDAYSEEINIDKHLVVNDASTLFLLYTSKLMLSIYFKDIPCALKFSRSARKYIKGGAGMYAFVLFHFYESLALLQDLANRPFFEKQKCLWQVRKNLKSLEKWSHYSPKNHLHRFYLVKAECFRVHHQNDQAAHYYELAIDQANACHFKHDEALCYELAATYYKNKNQTRFSHLLLRKSFYCYQHWGADAKIKQLQALHPYLEQYFNHPKQLEMGKPTYEATTSSSDNSSELDLQTLFNSSQAISGLIVLEDLIKTLLVNVIENVGAQRGFLILNRQEQLFVEAQGDIADEKQQVSSLQSLPINDAKHLLSIGVVNFVKNSGDFLVLDNAAKSENFSHDPYILKQLPVSVLCVPILNQGNLSGIVYLENNLTEGAFTEDRLELLQLLMAQAAISIENSNIYGQLEEKVEERTKELDKAYTQLTEANQKLEIQAKTDALTQLANRHYFSEIAEYEFNRCTREKQILTILMTDIDNFKAYNDTYGHLEGDNCLKQVAQSFKDTFTRKTDLVARYGGEEFIVILPETNSSEAMELAEKIRTNIEKKKIEHTGNSHYKIVTISIGVVSMIPSDTHNIDSLINEADKALYQAKSSGKNCVILTE